MNIAIISAEAGGNKGAEAMLEVLLYELLKEFPQADIFLEFTNNQDYYENTFLKGFPNSRVSLLPFRPKNFIFPYSNMSYGIDIAIDIGGINFAGNSNVGVLRSFFRYFPFLIKRKKLIFFTQDLGPAKNTATKILGSLVLKYSTAHFSRSLQSYNQAHKVFKLTESKMYGPYPDSTLLFSPNPDIELLKIGKEYVIFSPSAIMFKKHGQKYLDFFLDLYIKLKYKYTVVILVHNFTKNFSNTDEQVCGELKKVCEDAIMVNRNAPSSILKRFIGGAKFTISSRYHVVVGSISQNVPSIAIGWNPKYLSYLKLYNREDWNFDFEKVNVEDLYNFISSDNFVNSKDELNAINLELKKQVRESFVKLFQLIRSNISS